MGCAVQSTLNAGDGYTTVELKVNFVRPISAGTGEVRAEGKVIHVGKQIASAEGRLTDARGRLLAHATTTCLVFSFPQKRAVASDRKLQPERRQDPSIDKECDSPCSRGGRHPRVAKSGKSFRAPHVILYEEEHLSPRSW
jgi:hypothetical protein